MTTLAHKRETAGAGAGIALMLLLAAFLTQYLRTSWPFTAKPADRVHDAAAPPAAIDAHASHPQGAAPGSSPPGYAEVTIDPARASALGLTTVPVEERDFTRVVRTVGVITVDETRSAHVHSKVRGWIDGIHVDFVGRKVRAGEPLCSIYSQDVYAAEIEFVSILGRASEPTQPDPLLAAARRRLALWDVPQTEIARLESTREPRRTFPLLAPRAGTVVSKEAVEGMFVEPSLELYTLSDLSRLWVVVDVYEADVPWVHVGDRARLLLDGETAPVEGTVSFLSPTLDDATRTRKVRFDLPNPGGRFLPGAFATVQLDLPMGRGLAIPESAVIRTGKRSIAFVAHGDPAEHLEPRELTLGPLVGDAYRVEAGVSAGERVATGAQFLLDSESRLRSTSAPAGAHAH